MVAGSAVKAPQPQQRQQAGQRVSMLAENDHVVFVGVQQITHELGRAEDRVEHQVRLGLLQKRPGTVPPLSWAGPAPADAAWADPTGLDGLDPLDAQLG